MARLSLLPWEDRASITLSAVLRELDGTLDLYCLVILLAYRH